MSWECIRRLAHTNGDDATNFDRSWICLPLSLFSRTQNDTRFDSQKSDWSPSFHHRFDIGLTVLVSRYVWCGTWIGRCYQTSVLGSMDCAIIRYLLVLSNITCRRRLDLRRMSASRDERNVYQKPCVTFIDPYWPPCVTVVGHTSATSAVERS